MGSGNRFPCDIAGAVPLIGEWLVRFLRGGDAALHAPVVGHVDLDDLRAGRAELVSNRQTEGVDLAVVGQEADHAGGCVRRSGAVVVGDGPQHLLVVGQRVGPGKGQHARAAVVAGGDRRADVGGRCGRRV